MPRNRRKKGTTVSSKSPGAVPFLRLPPQGSRAYPVLNPSSKRSEAKVPADKMSNSNNAANNSANDEARGCVIKNHFFVSDGPQDADPMASLRHLQDAFKDSVDPDVVHMIFTESGFNVEKALEHLFTIVGESDIRLEGMSIENATNKQQLVGFPSLGPASGATPAPLPTPAPAPLPTPAPAPPPAPNRDDRETVSQSQPNSISGAIQAIVHSPSSSYASLSQANSVPFTSGHAVNGQKARTLQTQSRPKSKIHEIKETIRDSVQVLILMRGLPGSGKSTLAADLVRNTKGMVFSTDEFFMNRGVYRFNPSSLEEAHEWNQNRAKKAIQQGLSPVVIDNTNLQDWEMMPYICLAYQAGYKVFFAEPETNWKYNPNKCARFNTHGIPKNKVAQMMDRFMLNLNVEHLMKRIRGPSAQIKEDLKQKIEAQPVEIIESVTKQTEPEPDTVSTFSAVSLASETSESSSCGELKKSSSSNDSPEGLEDSSSANKIDLSLLLVLNKTNTDSEESSSLPASGGSSVGQEGGWERDEEFTWSCNQEEDAPLEGATGETRDDLFDALQNLTLTDLPESDPKPQREKRENDIEMAIEAEVEKVEQQALEECQFDDNWEESDNFGAAEAEVEVTNNGKRLFGLFGFKKGDWEFPSYPIQPNNGPDSDEGQRFLYFTSSSTQTETLDWALLELKRNSNGIADLEEIEPSDKGSGNEVVAIPANCLSTAVRMDRGTSVSDFPGELTASQKLDKLRVEFPQALETQLKEVLDACQGNYQWTFNLLSEFNEEHFHHIYPENRVAEFEETSPAQPRELTTGNSGLELVSEPAQDEAKFSLKLDPQFARALEREFGSISENGIHQDLTVNISHGVARLIHRFWKKSASPSTNEKNGKKGSILSNPIFKSSSSIFVKTLAAPSPSKQKDEQISQPKSEFQEIMDLELAITLSRQDQYALNEMSMNQNRELMATRLKREQLYATYPGVDEQFLEKIFEDNNYILADTINLIDQSMGEATPLSPQTQLWITAETSVQPTQPRTRSVRYIPSASAQYQANSSAQRSRSLSPVKQPKPPNRDFENLRSQMLKAYESKKEYQIKAKNSFTSKKYAVASYYSDQARKFQEKMESLSREIVKQVIESNGKSNVIDLHGLHLPEVQIVLSTFLQEKEEELERSVMRKMVVDIVTGWGAHGVAPRIKPAVINYLENKKYRYELINPGNVRVILTQ